MNWLPILKFIHAIFWYYYWYLGHKVMITVCLVTIVNKIIKMRPILKNQWWWLTLGINTFIGIDSLKGIDSLYGIDSSEELIPYEPISFSFPSKEWEFTIPSFEEWDLLYFSALYKACDCNQAEKLYVRSPLFLLLCEMNLHIMTVNLEPLVAAFGLFVPTLKVIEIGRWSVLSQFYDKANRRAPPGLRRGPSGARPRHGGCRTRRRQQIALSSRREQWMSRKTKSQTNVSKIDAGG